jgi:hypothetical protein
MKDGQHGGARSGAGRPRKESSALRDDTIVRKKLRGGAELGWEALADKYPSIMRAAIELALGGETGLPDKSMLKTLIELMPKVVGTDKSEDDSPYLQTLREMRNVLAEAHRTG